MEAKLTLKLDKTVIDSAKQYAEKNNRSLSKLVENYFKNLTEKKVSAPKYSPLIKSLIGVISESDLESLARADGRARYILRKEK